MRINLDGLDVVFPYPSMYPEQREYMLHLKKALDAKGHAVLEMPSGTGKTVTLLALITSYLLQRKQDTRKLIYCTRTVEEMQKVMAELRNLENYRSDLLGIENQLLCVGLASRRHLCINELVLGLESEIDHGCRSLTASWVRESVAIRDSNQRLCQYYENYDQEGFRHLLKPGVYDLSDLKELGRKKDWCPYFYARGAISLANVVVYSYHYLLDPKVSKIVHDNLNRETIIVFDEGHNIDNICIEAFSVTLTKPLLDQSSRSLTKLSNRIVRTKQEDAERFRTEYTQLLSGIAINDSTFRGGEDLAIGAFTGYIENQIIPQEIQKAEHFISFLRLLIQHFKERLLEQTALQESPQKAKTALNLQGTNVLQFTSDRLLSLMKTLQIADWTEYRSLNILSEFITILATYSQGFAVIFEPFDAITAMPIDVIELACLDASIAMAPVVTRYDSVILTSGTISPLHVYPKILNFRATVSASFTMSLKRKCICPLFISRGSDQTLLSSKYVDRQNLDVMRNYGEILLLFSMYVPDGVVAFFPSYIYMQEVVTFWKDCGLLDQLSQYKLLFIETPDPLEVSMALSNYRLACDSGRGGVLLSVARGRAAEGIDFDHHYGRCVIMFGVPFQYTESKVLKARLSYMRQQYGIPEEDFLIFDAMRQTAQCVGRVIRNKEDYGIMVFGDRRYSKHRLQSKLPKWIMHQCPEKVELDTTTALMASKKFLLDIAQGLVGD